MVLLEKLMVYNGILMETIRISVTVSIGLLLFFLAWQFRLVLAVCLFIFFRMLDPIMLYPLSY